MNEKIVEHEPVPYFAFEGILARSDRREKHLIIALIIAVVLMFASNALWLYAWMQYDYTSEEITYSQDGEGLNNINTGNQGDISYEPTTHD